MSTAAQTDEFRFFPADVDEGIQRYTDLTQITVGINDHAEGKITLALATPLPHDEEYPMGYGPEFDLTPLEARKLASALQNAAMQILDGTDGA